MSGSRTGGAGPEPGTITALTAVSAGLVGVVAGAAGGSGPLPAAAATAVVGLGVYRESRSLLALGSLGLVATAVVSGVTPGPAVTVPVSIGAGLLAWDAGTTSLDLRAQFLPAARSTRLEGVHIVVSTGIVTLGVAVAVSGPRLFGSVGSAGAAFLLLAVIGLLVALNNLR